MLVETKEDERGEYTRGLLNQTVLGLCTTIGSFWTTLLHGPEYNYGALDLNHLCTIPHRTTITPTYRTSCTSVRYCTNVHSYSTIGDQTVAQTDHKGWGHIDM